MSKIPSYSLCSCVIFFFLGKKYLESQIISCVAYVCKCVLDNGKRSNDFDFYENVISLLEILKFAPFIVNSRSLVFLIIFSV